MSGSRTCSPLIALATLLAPWCLGAQQSPPVQSRDTAGSQISLLTPRDAVSVVGIALAVAAIMPADRSIARAFQRRNVQSSDGLRRSFDAIDGLADPGAVIFSAVAYFAGLADHSRPIASLGMHTGEAIVLGGVIAESMKGAVGRARPLVDTADSRNFHPWHGFRNDDFASFPSAEVTVAFATATAASSEVERSWPGAARYVTPASFTAATLVGVARLYKNQHWASDVVAGAGLGTLSGILFDRYNRAYPANIFNRLFLPRSITPAGHDMYFTWVIPAG